MKRISLILFLIFIVGCAQNIQSEEKATNKQLSNSSDVVEVMIIKYKFVPEVVEIKKGQTIRWVNKEKRQYHNVWFKESGAEEPEYLFPDDTFEKQFNTKGDFGYICGPHPEMKGRVIVK